MASNDETVLEIPNIQCPSCKSALYVDGQKIMTKFSKEQRQNFSQGSNTCESSKPYTVPRRTEFDHEDQPSEEPEHEYVMVSCSNFRCRQYNKFKLLKLPKIVTPTIKVEL